MPGRPDDPAVLGATMRDGNLKLGVERVTWTGHVRDTILISILANEWRGARDPV